MKFWDRNTIDNRTKVYEDYMFPIFSDILNHCDVNEELESKIKRITLEVYNPYRHSSVNINTRYDVSQLERFESLGLAYIRIKLKESAANYYTEEILSKFTDKYNLELKWGVENRSVVNAIGNYDNVDSTLIYLCVSFDVIRDYKIDKILEK